MFRSLILTILILTGCNRATDPVPKPRAYPRVEFPPRNPVQFTREDCPFTFVFPDYGQIEKREPFHSDNPAHPCWFDIWMDVFNARLHCSYHQIRTPADLDEFVRDAFTIAARINQRSNYMDELRVQSAYGASGLVLEFTGPAASPMHFYLTDSTHHFLRASLYFNARVHPDSLQPITEFVKEDVAAMINSFRWLQ